MDLSIEDRQYLVDGNWPMKYDRATKTYVKFEPAPGREAELDALELVETDHELGMDNHGVIVCLCVYREAEGGPLRAFRWGYSSEERFFDYYSDNEPIEVEQKAEVVTVYSYTRAGGGPINP